MLAGTYDKEYFKRGSINGRVNEAYSLLIKEIITVLLSNGYSKK